MRDAVASQLIRDDLPGLTMMRLQQPPEETLGSRSVTTCLQKHIYHLTILVDSPPQALLFSSDLYKNLVDVECISISLGKRCRLYSDFDLLIRVLTRRVG